MKARSTTARVLRATCRAYLQPLVDGRAMLGAGLRKIWPGAGSRSVNSIFAVLLLAIAFGAGTLADMRARPERTEIHQATEVYRTGIGETRVVRLADGSEIHLAPGSELHVQFSSSVRRSDLARGEAYFNVEHDAKRPFEVRSGDFIVRDLGTRFTLRSLDSGTLRVTVSEGLVGLSHRPDGPNSGLLRQPLKLSAGQFVSVSENDIAVGRLSTAEIEARLAWRNRRFTFEGEALSDAVEDMNRFSARKIIIDDPSIASLPIAASFSVEQLDLFIDKLDSLFGVRHHGDDREIHLFGGSEAGRPHRDPPPQ